jgi:DNA polymerase-3 subunit epsilon
MSFATMPLDKVPIAVLDLEATGLRPRLDRIIQIGVVDLDAPERRLDLLVNPALPVPAASTAVHGINDAMLPATAQAVHFLAGSEPKMAALM